MFGRADRVFRLQPVCVFTNAQRASAQVCGTSRAGRPCHHRRHCRGHAGGHRDVGGKQHEMETHNQVIV